MTSAVVNGRDTTGSRQLGGPKPKGNSNLIGEIGGEPAVGADGEQHSLLPLHTADERAATFLAEVADCDGFSHLHRGGGGVDDGALHDHILVRWLLVLDDQRHRAGPLDQLGLPRSYAGVDQYVPARGVVVPHRDTGRRPAVGGHGQHGDMLGCEELFTLDLGEGFHTRLNARGLRGYSNARISLPVFSPRNCLSSVSGKSPMSPCSICSCERSSPLLSHFASCAMPSG